MALHIRTPLCPKSMVFITTAWREKQWLLSIRSWLFHRSPVVVPARRDGIAMVVADMVAAHSARHACFSNGVVYGRGFFAICLCRAG